MADEKILTVAAGDANEEHVDGADASPDFVPIVSLPEVPINTMEDEEEEMVKIRAKLFRYDTEESPPEWKERGTGDIKLLRHLTKNCCRVVMRRDKTFKVCANHYITPWMELKTNCGSDRAWVYSVPADYTYEQIRPELLAVKFANADNAQLWKKTFEEAKQIVHTQCSLYTNDGPSSDEDSEASDEEDDEKKEEVQEESATEVTEQLDRLTVNADVESVKKSE